MRYQAIALSLLLVLAGGTSAADTEIYRWVDTDGNVHYGDRPLGDNPELLDIESRPTDPARIQAMVTARSAAMSQAQQEEAEAAAEQPTAEELRAAADERAQKCTAYQAQLEMYLNNRRLYRQTEDGEREYLSDAEIDETRRQAQQRVQEFCS